MWDFLWYAMNFFLCGDYVILNPNEPEDPNVGVERPPLIEIASRIQDQMSSIVRDFVKPNEKGQYVLVDYEGIRNSDTFAEYLRTVPLLAKASLKKFYHRTIWGNERQDREFS